MYNFDNGDIISENDNITVISEMPNDLIEDFIEDQLENPFSYVDSENNLLELYMNKYRVVKDMYEDDDDIISQLKENKNNLMKRVVKRISNKFDFEIDLNEVKATKTANILFDFFMVNYAKNLSTFIANCIIKNKKPIIQEIKRINNSKIRDVSTVSKKSLFNNNDAVLLNNINLIIFDIIPGMGFDSSFLKYIIQSDDNYVYNKISKLFNDPERVIEADGLFESFLEPLLEKEDGFSTVITNVTKILYSTFEMISDIDYI